MTEHDRPEDDEGPDEEETGADGPDDENSDDEPADYGEAGDEPDDDTEHLQQEFQFTPVSARVPEKVAKGVFATGAIVLQGPDEFIIDFILKLAHPHQITTRVVLPISVVPRFIAALQENLRLYEQSFGQLPQMPISRQPGGDPPPDSIEDLYGQLKLPDEMLGGNYANAVMIGHAPAEFGFDFIANIYPKSVVTARVFMAAPQAPALLEVLIRTWRKFEETRGEEPPPPAPEDN